jgi:putative peptidoglycan lipid II flippase
MIASSVITLGSLPIYAALFQNFSTVGLVVASDLGIIANCSVMAVLLHRRGLVSLRRMNWGEVGKSALTAAFAAYLSMRIAAMVKLEGGRLADLKSLALTTVTWAAAICLGLWITKSTLLKDLRRKAPVPA